ncbi:hypothetical protein [Crossiella sp. NPDC003009]
MADRDDVELMARREARSALVRAAVLAQAGVEWTVVETCPPDVLRDADTTTAAYGGTATPEAVRDAVMGYLIERADYEVHGVAEACRADGARIVIGWEWDGAPNPAERAEAEAAKAEAEREKRRNAVRVGRMRRAATDRNGAPG